MRRQFRVAGITIELISADPRMLPPAQPPFDLFSDHTDTVAHLTLTLRRGDRLPRGRLLFDSGAVWRLYELGERLLIECHSEIFGEGPYKSAVLDRDLGKGELVMHVDEPLEPLEFPLDEVLVNEILARNGGVELHCCGLIDGGRGLLFVGQSGAGKTTTARLWKETPILSDDRIIVREEEGALRMYGTPWHGEAALSSPGSAPLAAVYLLVQAQENAIVPLSAAEAAARLLACSFPPFHDAEALAQTIDFLARIAAGVPVSELRFVPDERVVDFVRQRR
jgi:hypothetical protein